MKLFVQAMSLMVAMMVATIAFSDTPVGDTLAAHNAVRDIVNTGTGYNNPEPVPNPFLTNMSWDQGAADAAQAWANQCIWRHKTDGYGQNMAMNSRRSDIFDAVGRWAMEYEDFNYPTGPHTGVVGHYTQLVWANSTGVGCGIKWCDSMEGLGYGGTFVVCNYNPPGNYGGYNNPYTVTNNHPTNIVRFMGKTGNLHFQILEANGLFFRVHMDMAPNAPEGIVRFKTLVFEQIDRRLAADRTNVANLDGQFINVPRLTLSGTSGSYWVKLKHMGDLIFDLVDWGAN